MEKRSNSSGIKSLKNNGGLKSSKKSGNFKSSRKVDGFKASNTGDYKSAKAGDFKPSKAGFTHKGHQPSKAEGSKPSQKYNAGKLQPAVEGGKPPRIKFEERRANQPKTFRRRPKPRPVEPREDDGKVRLNKYLADAGVASRRKCDELIEEGSVTINGRKVFELGIRVDPKNDKVLFRGKPLAAQTKFVYYIFNKPKAVVTSTVDPQGRPTVIDYFGKVDLRLFPVGRLDWDTEGLLLVTNDGEFAQKIIHPEAGVSKTYHAKLDNVPTEQQLEKLRKGVSTINGKVAALRVKRLQKSTDKKSWIEITIAEGKNHQVKNMFAKIGHDVIKLRRVAIGELWMNASLKSGEFRELTYADLKKIFKKPGTPGAKKEAEKSSVRSDSDDFAED